MFISMGMLEIIQILSVFFGTLIAAPLIVSKKAKKRMMGLFAEFIGYVGIKYLKNKR